MSSFFLKEKGTKKNFGVYVIACMPLVFGPGNGGRELIGKQL